MTKRATDKRNSFQSIYIIRSYIIDVGDMKRIFRDLFVILSSIYLYLFYNFMDL